MKLNLNMNVTPSYNFVIQFQFWIYVDSGILTKLDPCPEPILIPVSIDFEIEPPLLDSYISLMGTECEIKFCDLDSTLEPKPTLEPKVDFLELVLVPKLFISEPKSSIP